MISATGLPFCSSAIGVILYNLHRHIRHMAMKHVSDNCLVKLLLK